VEESGNRRERGEERRGTLERVRVAFEEYRIIILGGLKSIGVKQGEWEEERRVRPKRSFEV